MLLTWVLMLYRSETKIIFLIFLLNAAFFREVKADSGRKLCLFQKSILETGNTFYEREQYLLSATQYSLLFRSDCDDLNRKSRYNFSLAMIQLGEVGELLNQYRFFKKNNFSEAESMKVLMDYSSGNENHPRVKLWKNLYDKKLVKNLGMNDPTFVALQNEYYQSSNNKNPYVAGILSAFVPGAGQVYNGTYQSAVISFLLNSLFLWSTVEFERNRLNGPAVASGLVFSVTYVGGIMNAARGSNNINRMKSRNVKRKIKHHLFPELELRR